MTAGLDLGWIWCSRLKPSSEFHFEGLSYLSLSIEGKGWFKLNPRRQSKNIEMKYKTHMALVHELNGTCFQYNMKNQE